MPYRLKVLAQQAGFRGLFAGLGPRMVMTAGLVSGQFLLYGAIKDGEFSSASGRSGLYSSMLPCCRRSSRSTAGVGDSQGELCGEGMMEAQVLRAAIVAWKCDGLRTCCAICVRSTLSWIDELTWHPRGASVKALRTASSP